MKKFLVLLSIALLMSCNRSNNYIADEIFTTTFSEDDVVEINSLIDYVDKLVTKETDHKDINAAYHAYFVKLKTNWHPRHLIVPIPCKEKFSFLEHIKKSTLDEFWRVDSGGYNTTRYYAPCPKSLIININGKYVDYLKEVGKSDSIYFDLQDNIVTMGDIPKGGVIRFLADNNSIDFGLIKNRLLAMVCIFSIEEPLEKIGE
jgi:hypothetical protein